MSQNFVLILGLGLGFLLIRKFLFTPSKKHDRHGFRKRFEARKKEKLNAGDESLHPNRR